MQFTVNLAANVLHRQQTAGRYFMLYDIGAASSVEVKIYRGTELLEHVRTAKRGLKAEVAGGFTHVELQATVIAACEVIISDGSVDIGFVDGQAVNATIVSPNPLPVSNDRGSPGNPMHVNAVTVADAPAVAASTNAAVAMSAVAAVIAAADATRRAIRFHNLGASDVAIGPAGLTWAQRVIVLKTGDVWVEDRAANLAWSGITDAGGAASITWSGVTA